MRIERLSLEDVQKAGGPRAAAGRLRRLAPAPERLLESVREIVREVAAHGDRAVLRFTQAYDSPGGELRPLIVAQQELDEAIRGLPMDVIAGLQVAIANVATVAQAGVGREVSLTLPQSQRVILREVPVQSAAVYVPGGRAPYPSTAVMGVVTARAAGVLDVVVCTPPGPDGQIDPAILGACRLLGVQRVYRMGGAQAIAALAFGTETVGRVDVIVGPGSLWVQQAKREVADVVGIDGFAGPSDLMVLLGEDADPGLAALDLLAQAEHGAASLVLAASSSRPILDSLAERLGDLLGDLSAARSRPAGDRPGRAGAPADGGDRQARAGGSADGGDELAACVLVEVADARMGVELANELAPEHLQLVGAQPEALAPLVRTAGCLLVGAASATAFSDYVAGSNHILPTAGAARFSSGLSPAHFRRRMSEVRIDPGGALKLARAGAPIARAEGFEWHARSMEARVRENDGS